MEQHAAVFLNLQQAAQAFPLSPRKLRQLIKEQRLPAFRLDGKLIVKREDLENLLTMRPANADPRA